MDKIHLALSVLHYFNAIFCGVSAGVKPVSVSIGYFAYRTNSTLLGDGRTDVFSQIGYFPAGEMHLKWVSFAFNIVSGLQHTFEYWLHVRSVRFSVQKDKGKPSLWRNYPDYLETYRHNPIRWISFAVGSSLMTMGNARLSGDNTVTGLLTIIGCNLAMILCGNVSEQFREVNNTVWSMSGLYYFIGWIFGLVIFVHDVILIASAPPVPPLVYTIIFINYGWYFSFAAVAFYELRSKKSYEVTDKWYCFLSATAKPTLSYQYLGALGFF